MIVRTAVLKGKDPLQILAEMEKIDQMGKVKFGCTFRENTKLYISMIQLHFMILKRTVYSEVR